MCLILLAYRSHPEYPLVVAANRDEFYARDTRNAHFWDDNPEVLAGRDLEAGGTWLGVTRNGRFAAVTNFAEPNPPDAPLSRGDLTQSFLGGTDNATDYAVSLNGPAYRGYNLLLWDGQDLVYTSNRIDEAAPRVLQPGIYGLANAALGAEWPKVLLGTRLLGAALAESTPADVPAEAKITPDHEPHPSERHLIELLGDRRIPPDRELPDTGRPLDMVRRTASCFIAGDEYGTRASTSLWLGRDHTHFAEHTFSSGGVQQQLQRFRWANEL